MKKSIRLTAAAALAAAGVMVSAGAANFTGAADRLHEVGLFQGTGVTASGAPVYELDRTPTRAEAAVMLVRLLGKEADAKALTYTAPFTDLEGWEAPYVQYLYDNKLTTGATATTFEPKAQCSAQMYTTFLLRSLGYSDAEGGDFKYSDALGYAENVVGLIDDTFCDTKNFKRDNVAAMSLEALGVSLKESNTHLIDKLIADGKIVVMTTQVMYEGSDMEVYEVGHVAKERYGLIESYDMTLEATVTKLMWIMAQTKDPQRIKAMFYTTINHDILFQ